MTMPIIDLHEDLLIAERAGENGTGPQTGFDEIAASQVRIVLATGFTDVKDFFAPSANALFEEDINEYVTLCARDERFTLVRSASDIQRVLEQPDKRGIIFHIEGFNAVGTDREMTDILEKLYAKGLRSIGPLWMLKNAFGGGNNDVTSGLTQLGVSLIEWCESHGVIFDLAHMNAQTFEGALKRLKRPPLVSHTACYSIVASPRNIADEQLKRIGNMGGVAGVFFAAKYATRHAIFTISDIADQLMHIINTAGEDSAALGTDYGGVTSDMPSEMPTPKELPRLFDVLRERGVTETVLEKIAYRNAQRVLEAHLD